MGARSLRSAMDSVLISTMFRAPDLSQEGVTTINFTEFGKPPMLTQKGKDIVDKNQEIIKNQKERAMGPLMGIVMKELRGKASGEIINKLLLKNIKKKLESN